MTGLYQTPEQAALSFGKDEQGRQFLTKHEIRKHAKESGIFSRISRGKVVFTEAQLEDLQQYIITKQANVTTPAGEVDNFAS